jgi:aspartate kinase
MVGKYSITVYFNVILPPIIICMKVFKFGGASVKDADAVRNVARVLNQYKNDQLLIVVSAMGKSTNALEKLAVAYDRFEKEEMQTIYKEIKSFHDGIIADLLTNSPSHAYDDIENLFIELECMLETYPEHDRDTTYDQIVSYGEIISTRIVSAYLNEAGIKNRWMDARNFVSTDATYREGKVDWQTTQTMIERKLKPIVQKQIVVTQGFIGQSREHLTTTLGREGSDYSAAIFAFGLNAESVTIWKDVAGVMNADPKKIPDAVKLDALSYTHAIEMAYYGATVIHPKTIQPLKSKNIPLYVKSFINPDAPGTVVNNQVNEERIPVIISKTNQVLISISSRDFSFIVEDNLSKIFSLFAEHQVKINLMQNSAISFSVCVDDTGEKIERLKNDLNIEFNVRSNEALEMYTVMYYDEPTLKNLLKNRELLLEQRTRNTIQMVVK